MNPGSSKDHAIVIGGSMAGLLAARVLSKHFTRVTIIDRDEFPKDAAHRRFVPQSRHTHGLLASGRQVLETYFPGLREDLLGIGALPGDLVGDSRWFLQGGRMRQVPSGIEGLLVSRPALEAAIRRRTLQTPNIHAIENRVVESLVTTADRTTVTGVSAGGETIAADLVVDASGRASNAPDWLDLLGYQRAPVEKVEVGVGYTTRLFRRKAGDLGGDVAVVIPAAPDCQRGGVMLAQEGDRWTVTLFSYFRDFAPADLEGFREWAKRLPSGDIFETIKDAEPIGEAFTSRFPASVRNRYEKLTRFPAGLLVFGDAICSFNPTFGQGMSTAALEAVELDRCLQSNSGTPLFRRFFTSAARVIDIPWSVSVGADLALPCTKAPRSLGVTVVNWYVAKLHKAAHTDPVASIAFHKVANLLAPPPSIMRPRIAWRVLLARLGFDQQMTAQAQLSPVDSLRHR